jgi:hypothetical protein
MTAKNFRWNAAKNEWLKRERKISFEQVLLAIDEGGLMSKIEHPNRDKYPNQRIFEVFTNNYVYLVPFVEDADGYFLKTIIPSRSATKRHKLNRS